MPSFRTKKIPVVTLQWLLTVLVLMVCLVAFVLLDILADVSN